MKLKIENYKLKIPAQRAGMTLFIAIMIMSVLLFISFAVINIGLKATTFATSGRDSQYAFYAADSGTECAVYWDSKPATGSAFATSTSGDSLNFTCAGSADMNTGQAIVGTSTLSRIGGGGSANPTSIFGFVMNQGSDPVNYCAIVTVTKNLNGTTYIKSRGYNTCDTSNTKRVERGVEVTY
ncbi:MAG: pilus assembly PilX N-terminal domain-containing protein [Candidatus Paceibacterota bacterium]|jgi:Tfp pilus assembly protein PilX